MSEGSATLTLTLDAGSPPWIIAQLAEKPINFNVDIPSLSGLRICIGDHRGLAEQDGF